MGIAIQSVALTIFSLQALAAPGKEVPIRVLGLDTGGFSTVSGARIQLARDPRTWSEIWYAHRGGVFTSSGGSGVRSVPNAPPVDFDKTMVLVVFGGGLRNVYGYRVVASTANKTRALVRLAPIFQRFGTDTMNAPYAFVLLPQSKLPLEVEMATPGDGAQVTWRRVARFEPPAAPK